MKDSILNWYKIVFLLTILVVTLFGCNSNLENPTVFKSSFEGLEVQPLLGTVYETNALQDWQVSENRIECLVSKENRYIRLKTHRLIETEGNLEMTVGLGVFNQTISSSNKNWAGFSIGPKDGFSDGINTSYSEKGIQIGVCTNGALFIGTPSPNHKNETIINALKTGVDLKVLVTYKNSGYTIDFSVLDKTNGKVLGRISKNNVVPEYLVGDLVLMTTYETSNTKLNNIKSVWFKNWEIKGSKVRRHEGNAFATNN